MGPLQASVAVALGISGEPVNGDKFAPRVEAWQRHWFWGTTADHLSFGVLLAHNTVLQVLEGYVRPGPESGPFSWWFYLTNLAGVLIVSWLCALMLFVFLQAPLEHAGCTLIGQLVRRS